VVHDSFRAVKRNRGAAGIDKVSIKLFEANLLENLCSVMTDLKNGSFEPKPLRRHFLDKGGGKLRPLGIPTVSSYCTWHTRVLDSSGFDSI
jgi:RNA-directed DNA polymerase